MTEISGKKFTANLIWRLLERFGAQGISFVVSIVLARILDPGVYGTIALVTVFTSLLQVFVDSGLGNALIQKKEVDDIDYSSVFYFNVVFGFVLYAIMFWAAPYIAMFYRLPDLTPVIRVLSLTVIVSSIKNIQQAYVSRNMLFKLFFYSTIGGTVIAAAIGIIMAYNNCGVWALVALNLINLCIDTAILWITVKWKPKLLFSWERLKVLLSFGWKLLFARLVETFYAECRSLIIGRVYSSEDLAFFNRGKQYPNLLVVNIDYSLTSVLFPVMSASQDDKEKCRAIVRRAITTNVFIIAPLMMGMAVCAEPIVRLILTDKWLPCVPYMRIFCFSLVFLTFNTANMNSYRSLGRSDIYLKIELVRKVFGMIVLVLTMKFGVMWIAYGEIIATLISMIVTATPNKEFIGYGFLEQLRDVIPSLFLSVVMGCCVYPVLLLGLSDARTLLIQIVVGVIVYLLGSIIFKLEPFVYLKNMILTKRI